MGFCDAWGKGWEEYVWLGKPFGLHVRPIKQLKKGMDLKEIILKLKGCLASFTERVA